MIMNLYLWVTAAAATFLLIVTVTVVIVCTTCVILWRKKCEAPLTSWYNLLVQFTILTAVKFNPSDDVFVMTQENPAYATVKAMSNVIVTQKNRAYEEVIKIHKNTWPQQQ